MKYLRNILFIYLIIQILIGEVASNGKIELNSKVDRSKITIGDLITYSIIIKRDKDVEIILPSLGANLGQFEIRDYKIYDKRKEDNKIIEQVDYIISTFDIGEYEIPSVEIKYKIKGSKEEGILKTDKIVITVESVKPSEAGDIREIKPPVEIPYNWKPLIYWALIVLGLIIIAIAVVYIVKRRKRIKEIMPQFIEAIIPPHELAYQRLKKLEESELLVDGKVKQYYIEISEIIRKYIEGRYSIIAMELTTTDLIIRMNGDGISPDHIAMFEEFLNKCDLVKFAKYIPTDVENNDIMKLALDIIDKTKMEVKEGLASTGEQQGENFKKDNLLRQTITEEKGKEENI